MPMTRYPALSVPTRSHSLRLPSLLPQSLLQLLARLAIASVCLLSGRDKMQGLLTLKPATYDLFRHEYALPLIAPELAAQIAALAEHVIPVLLLVGLFTRSTALTLLVMTVLVEVFVHPAAWPVHLIWLSLLLPLVAHTGGPVSLDHVMQRQD
ncbi:DoxX family protein [Pseudoduganella sp. RAF53_2]|uniref:DoxX family protein n=1 Tax=unclassified Pseudoduganella TaxID=2637179 RepID=UPI003F9DBAFC